MGLLSKGLSDPPKHTEIFVHEWNCVHTAHTAKWKLHLIPLLNTLGKASGTLKACFHSYGNALRGSLTFFPRRWVRRERRWERAGKERKIKERRKERRKKGGKREREERTGLPTDLPQPLINMIIYLKRKFRDIGLQNVFVCFKLHSFNCRVLNWF